MGVNSFAEALFLSKKFQLFFQTMQNMICLHGILLVKGGARQCGINYL